MGRTQEQVTVKQTRIDKKRTFGVEIELISEIPMYDLAEELRSANIECYDEHYNHCTRHYWKIVSDSSVTCGYENYPMELVSPPLCGREGLEELERVCKVLYDLGCYVNASCGLHVHHDAADFDIEAWQVFTKNILKYESTMDALHPWDRRQNNWACGSMATRGPLPQLFARVDESEDVSEISYIWRSRFRKVNLQAFDDHGTIEFRQHEGTTDFKDIAAWVSLTQGLVARGATGKRMRMRGTTRPFESLMLTANACASVRRHFLNKYNP